MSGAGRTAAGSSDGDQASGAGRTKAGGSSQAEPVGSDSDQAVPVGSAAGAAGEVGDAGWRTGEIGLDVNPKEVRPDPPGEAGPWAGDCAAGISPVGLDGSAESNQGGLAASGRAGGRR